MSLKWQVKVFFLKTPVSPGLGLVSATKLARQKGLLLGSNQGTFAVPKNKDAVDDCQNLIPKEKDISDRCIILLVLKGKYF